MEPEFLYLVTKGWKSGKSHQIEIWFVQHESCYYLVSGQYEKSHWVQNIQHDPAITFWVGDTTYHGRGRVVNRDSEPELATAVSAKMDAKYDWSEGLIVELCPNS